MVNVYTKALKSTYKHALEISPVRKLSMVCCGFSDIINAPQRLAKALKSI